MIILIILTIVFILTAINSINALNSICPDGFDLFIIGIQLFVCYCIIISPILHLGVTTEVMEKHAAMEGGGVVLAGVINIVLAAIITATVDLLGCKGIGLVYKWIEKTKQAEIKNLNEEIYKLKNEKWQAEDELSDLKDEISYTNDESLFKIANLIAYLSSVNEITNCAGMINDCIKNLSSILWITVHIKSIGDDFTLEKVEDVISPITSIDTQSILMYLAASSKTIADTAKFLESKYVEFVSDKVFNKIVNTTSEADSKLKTLTFHIRELEEVIK